MASSSHELSVVNLTVFVANERRVKLMLLSRGRLSLLSNSLSKLCLRSSLNRSLTSRVVVFSLLSILGVVFGTTEILGSSSSSQSHVLILSSWGEGSSDLVGVKALKANQVLTG